MVRSNISLLGSEEWQRCNLTSYNKKVGVAVLRSERNLGAEDSVRFVRRVIAELFSGKDWIIIVPKINNSLISVTWLFYMLVIGTNSFSGYLFCFSADLLQRSLCVQDALLACTKCLIYFNQGGNLLSQSSELLRSVSSIALWRNSCYKNFQEKFFCLKLQKIVEWWLPLPCIMWKKSSCSWLEVNKI